MARTTTVKAARKPQGNCGRCGKEIRKGDSYVHASPGFRSRKLVRCTDFDCRFRQSDLTTSKLSAIYAAQEGAEDDIAALDADSTDKGTLEQILEAVADAADEVAQEYRDASDAWADGQGHEEWTDWAEECETYADDLRSVASDLEEPPEEDAESEGDEDEDPSEDGNAKVLWFDEAVETIETAIGEFSL